MTEPRLIVECACGWTAQGSEDEVVAAAREHGEQLHNMTVDREQVLAMSRPAGPDGAPD